MIRRASYVLRFVNIYILLAMAMFLLHCAEIQLFRELCVSLRKQKLTVSSRNVLNFELFMRNEMFAFCCC